jgi:N-acetylmuramoyl-L-alanine amidase
MLGCARPVTVPEKGEPLSTPPRWLVILDAGHGGFDAGASGTATGVKESELNLQVALLVRGALEDAGVQVVMTRTGPEALGPTKGEDMSRRGQMLLTEGADAAVSIHMNKFSDRKVRGPMAYYQAGAAEGEKLAVAVIDSLTEALVLKPRRANPGNNFVTRIPVCPAVLVECGFLSHPEEERLLQDEAYQRTLAEAVARGVIAYLEGAGTSK